MTIVEDRPMTGERPPFEQTRVPRATSPAASWRFAGRLARREVRRRPGRTMLVMLLVALPVFAMTVAVIAARTNDVASNGSFAREFGRADLSVIDYGQVDSDGATVQARDDSRVFDEGPALPAGTTTLSYFETWTSITGQDAAGVVVRPSVHFVVVDASDPMLSGMYRIERGRAAAKAGEVMLSADIANLLGVDVGDTLTLTRPDITVAVVGIHAESQWLDNDSMIMPGFDTAQIRPEAVTVRTLIDLPPATTPAEVNSIVLRFRSNSFEAQSAADRGWDQTYLGAQELAWGWVAGMVAFIAVGIVIAAAFATSARRQLATVGQLSANGAPERLIRRTLGLQGMWTGALGAALGIGAGVVGALAGQRYGVGDLVSGYAVNGIRIQPLDLVVIALTALAAATIAALVPARSAARIPVLSALAGRRPVSAPPRWLVPVGLGLFGFGVFLIAGAAGTSNGGNFEAAIAVLGVLGVLFGVVCSSPLIVAWVSKVGSARGGVTRLAARSLGRSRMRSAGVLTAVATVSAIAIAGLTTVDSVQATEQRNSTNLNDGSSFMVWSVNDSYAGAYDENGNFDPDFDPPPALTSPVPDELRSRIESILPQAKWKPITSVVFDELPQSFYDIYPIDRPLVSPTIADDVALSLLNLSSEQTRQLNETGVLNTSSYLTGPLSVSVNNDIVDLDAGPPAAMDSQVSLIPSRFQPDILITPEYARAQGFPTQVSMVIVNNPVDITNAERASLNSGSGFSGADSFVGENALIAEGQWSYYVDGTSFEVPWALIQLGVLAAALLMVLLVVAIGLSLAATESKDERDVLHTVGASPATLRRVAAAKAWVITTGAAAVAIPAGYLVVRVVTWANNETAPFPFVGAIGIAIVIPALAWAATLAVSAIAQKARPIQISTITLD